MKHNTTIPVNPLSPCCQSSPTVPQCPSPSTSVTWYIPRALLSIGVALCGASATFAQSLPPWSTVDDIENGSRTGIAADRAGNVFVAGEVSVAGVRHPCITRSSDRGATWISTVFTDAGDDYFNDIAAATVEVVPATNTTPAVLQDQLVTLSSSQWQWTTRRSLDAGATWETVDIFTPDSSTYAPPGARCVAIDSAGNTYVVGYSTTTKVVKNKTSYPIYWVVRKISKDATAASEAGKTTFELLDSISPGYFSMPSGVTCVGTNVFVAGNSGDRWQVRKYSGSGATWDLVDNFRYDENYASEPMGIAADTSGNLYVVGGGWRAVGSAHPKQATSRYWIVRKGSGAGANSFQTVDRFELEPNKRSLAWAVSADPSGDVHVTGSGSATVGSSTNTHWITRRLSAATGTWSTTDHYFLAPSYSAEGHYIVADPAGNVFAAGTAADGTSNHAWVVRRQLAP